MRRLWRLWLAAWLAAAGVLAGWPAAQAGDSGRAAALADGGAEIARVYFDNEAELNFIVTHFDALEYADRDAGYVLVLLLPGEAEGLRQAGFRVEVDTAATRTLQPPTVGEAARAGTIAGFDCYRTVEQTYADLAQLAADYPDLATWIDIGDSWEKVTPDGAPGYDLRALVVTNKQVAGPKPVFFLMAAVHAREYATAELAARFAERLVTQYGVDPDVTWLLDHFAVHIVPHANPDGRKVAEAGYFQRKNTHPVPPPAGTCTQPPQDIILNHYGVDLNRNSSFAWGGPGSESHPCEQAYRGEAPASEPETQALQAYVAGLFPDQRGPNLDDAAPDDATGVFISLHSFASLVLLPWGHINQPAPNHSQLLTLGRKFGYYNGYGVCQSRACLYPTSGTNDEWAYGELGVAAFTIELGRNTFFHDCATFEGEMLPSHLPLLLYAAKAAYRPYQQPAGPDAVDLSLSTTVTPPGLPVVLSAVLDDTRYYGGKCGACGGAEPVQPIAAARYSLAAPAWISGTVTVDMTPADGAWDSPVETAQAVLDTTGWAPGRYLLLVQGQDANGQWGVPSAIYFTVASHWLYLPFVPHEQP